MNMFCLMFGQHFSSCPLVPAALEPILSVDTLAHTQLTYHTCDSSKIGLTCFKDVKVCTCWKLRHKTLVMRTVENKNFKARGICQSSKFFLQNLICSIAIFCTAKSSQIQFPISYLFVVFCQDYYSSNQITTNRI